MYVLKTHFTVELPQVRTSSAELSLALTLVSPDLPLPPHGRVCRDVYLGSSLPGVEDHGFPGKQSWLSGRQLRR